MKRDSTELLKSGEYGAQPYAAKLFLTKTGLKIQASLNSREIGTRDSTEDSTQFMLENKVFLYVVLSEKTTMHTKATLFANQHGLVIILQNMESGAICTACNYDMHEIENFKFYFDFHFCSTLK